MNYRKTLVCTTVMHPAGIPHETAWLIESAERHGIELTVIGQGMQFENWWLSKFVRLWEAVGHRQEFDNIVFIDGTDSLFATGLEELLEGFPGRGDFVVAGESNCWPFWELGNAPAFDQCETYRYPNPGFWMATWPAFQREMAALLAMPHTEHQVNGETIYNNDQGRIGLGIAQGRLDITIDVARRCSLALHYLGDRTTTDPEIEWGPRPRIVATNVRPCTIHCNGAAKSQLPLVRELLADHQPRP